METSLGVFRLVKEHQPGLLFVIYRSSNTNCVTYFVDPAEPDSVQVRWHMCLPPPTGWFSRPAGTSGHQMARIGRWAHAVPGAGADCGAQRLTMLERNTAYGLSQQPGADGAILVRLAGGRGAIWWG